MRTLADLVAESPTFSGMAPERLAIVTGCASNTGFDAGETIFREGDPADVFYLVRTGTVALEIHAPGRGGLTIETLHEGDVLGWSWLFPPHRWQFDARALAPVRAVAFDGACLRGKSEADPALGYDLMTRFARVMVERLQATRLRLLDVYGHVAAG
jgi:CRP/FNR family transcriptional regulator, cyclic AMP receptor protein